MRYVLASLGVAVLAACAGGGSTVPAPPPPVCNTGTAVDAQARLVSPPAGATGVSPSIGSISFSYTNPATPGAVFVLTPSDGSAPLNTTSGTVISPVSGIWTLVIPPLKPSTTYTVTGSSPPNFAHLPCFVNVTANLGSFTTQ